MGQHKCIRCGREFTHLCHLKRHISTKVVCEPLLQNISKDTMMEILNNTRREASSHFCEDCNIGFKTRQGLYYHSKRCNKKQPNTGTEDLREEIRTLKMEIAELKLNHGNITNITNINTLVNNGHITIILPYGQEKIDHVERLMTWLTEKAKNPLGGVPQIVRQIHYHPEHKENHNVAMNDKREIFVHDGSKWVSAPKKATLDKTIAKAVDVLEAHFDQHVLNSEDYNFVTFHDMHHFKRTYHRGDGEIIQKLRRRVEDVIDEGTKKHIEGF
jgi:hypothetical protein